MNTEWINQKLTAFSKSETDRDKKRDAIKKYTCNQPIHLESKKRAIQSVIDNSDCVLPFASRWIYIFDVPSDSLCRVFFFMKRDSSTSAFIRDS